ncbi:MAG: metalloregulator ArsR/SmtB family transcription factor [Chloroflexota bacterium]
MTDDLNSLWKALSDPTRRHILDLLRQAPHTTGELSDIFADDLSRYAVMKHLNVLAEANLITIRRKGRERYNHLNVVPLQQMYEHWLRPYEQAWASSLINLKNQAEGVTSMETSKSLVHQIEQEIIIETDVDKAFSALLDINGWWGPRFSQYPDSLRLEAQVGGRFWETRDGTGNSGVLWATVTSIQPNDHIRLQGSIGMPGAVSGSVMICTNPQEDGTTQVTLSHQFVGDVDESYLTGFTEGWDYNLNNLKKLCESGERVQRPQE